MISKAMKILSDEHVYILKVIDLLERECDSLENNKSIDKTFFTNALKFIRNYADKLHHAKEEDILFKEMCKRDVEKKIHCNPIDQMLHEHNIGRNFIKKMEEGIYKNNPKQVSENCREYCQLLKDHIYKEDNILYPMADEVLGTVKMKELYKKFSEIDRKRKSEISNYIKFSEIRR